MANTFTKLYLTADAATFDPATVAGAWDSSASKVIRKLESQKNDGGGGTTTIGVAETSATNPFRVLLYQGISGPVAAQTISGTVNVTIGILESSASALDNWGVHIWVTQGNSGTARGTLLTNYNEGAGVNVWPTTATGKTLNAAQTMTNVVASAGDRIVVELGYYARNTVTTSFTGTIRYGICDATTLTAFGTDLVSGDTGTNLTTRAPFILFGTAITEGTIDGRLSQAGRESYLDMNPTANLSQAGRESYIDTNPQARLSQGGREIFISGAAVQTGWNPLLSHKRNRMIS